VEYESPRVFIDPLQICGAQASLGRGSGLFFGFFWDFWDFLWHRRRCGLLQDLFDLPLHFQDLALGNGLKLILDVAASLPFAQGEQLLPNHCPTGIVRIAQQGNQFRYGFHLHS
jgi:hypothetical protein